MVQNYANGNGRQRNGQFSPGTSGNPGRRPSGTGDMRAAAQAYAGEALRTLAELLQSENQRLRVQAATALLDRGFGKPGTVDDDTSRVKPISQMSYEGAAEVLETTPDDLRRQLEQSGQY
jgi:hypothetical protein